MDALPGRINGNVGGGEVGGGYMGGGDVDGGSGSSSSVAVVAGAGIKSGFIAVNCDNFLKYLLPATCFVSAHSLPGRPGDGTVKEKEAFKAVLALALARADEEKARVDEKVARVYKDVDVLSEWVNALGAKKDVYNVPMEVVEDRVDETVARCKL